MLSIALLSIALCYNTFRWAGDGRFIATVICLVTVAFFEVSVIAYPILRGGGEAGGYFFWLAGCLSLFVVFALGVMKKTPLTQDLIYLNCFAFFVQLYGFYSWQNDLSLLVYTNVLTFTIVIEFVRLMLRTKSDGIHRSNAWLRNIRSDDSSDARPGNT